MHLFAFGINHMTAPISVREHVAFHDEGLGAALHDLSTRCPVKEAAILSTCNRTELYCNTREPQPVLEWLAHYHRLQWSDIQPYTYARDNVAAVKHTFRVASGLDSMVLGEPQILGQMKQAVKVAEQVGTLGTLLHKLFQHTFSVAKEVRTSTDIGASSISMAAASVKLAQRIFGDLRPLKVLFIGAGEMIALCAEHFSVQQPAQMVVANRTLDRGLLLAQKLGGSAILLVDLPERLAEFDIVITCTASQLPILGLGLMERAVKLRRHRPMFVVDLAVPRDVEGEVANLDDVFLYTVDDLANIVQEGMHNRQQAAVEAEAIVEVQVQHFMRWMEVRGVVPTIRALREQAEWVRDLETEKAVRQLARGDDPLRVLESLSHAMTNKFLHGPSHALNHADRVSRETLEAALRQLFQLRD